MISRYRSIGPAMLWRARLAAERRQDVAMGVSPWNTKQTTHSPEGTKGTLASEPPFAPLGLRDPSPNATHGLAPMATAFRPFRTETVASYSGRGSVQ